MSLGSFAGCFQREHHFFLLKKTAACWAGAFCFRTARVDCGWVYIFFTSYRSPLPDRDRRIFSVLVLYVLSCAAGNFKGKEKCTVGLANFVL
jgi:hypothetical protein